MDRLGLFIALLLSVTFSRAAHEASRILSLPGFDGDFASPHYAGYIDIDEYHGRSLYYYFVTSERNASSDPLILWLNGGPGCSSFDGFVYEHGPFTFEPGKEFNDLPKLSRNPYTWAKIASILYLDSPAGAGFSYSNTTSDYVTGDFKTARDSHKFILKWFELFPEYLSNEFYVMGESYAGIYVPNLSQEIVNGIEGGIMPAPKFKGYMIGNAYTDDEYDGNSLVPFIYGMGLISMDLYQGILEACNGNYWNATNADCISKISAAREEVADLNVYNVLEPCYHNPKAWEDTHLRLPHSFRKLGETSNVLPVRKRMFGRAWPLMMRLKPGIVPSWKELGEEHLICMNTQLSHIWLNNPSVREALHAKPKELIGRWTVCSDVITYDHDSGSKIPIHKNLTRKGYRAHVYSGDHDMCVPYTGSEAWTRAMGYETLSSWRPWFVDGQVAGYTVRYANELTFTTVKGSGHTVPEYKPREALAMLQRWLSGLPL